MKNEPKAPPAAEDTAAPAAAGSGPGVIPPAETPAGMVRMHGDGVVAAVRCQDGTLYEVTVGKGASHVDVRYEHVETLKIMGFGTAPLASGA